MSDDATSPNNPSSWRDVYTLVQDVERRLTTRMDDIAKAAAHTANDHEVRLRVLEKTSNGMAQRDSIGISLASGAQRFAILAVAIAALVVAIIH